ncbi:MAG: hypothetical protein PHD81_02230 [Candidatus Nanoarchaeia archaeon]|nr:hypothetical protein [Candidatus Nanoarchaeia archaeon]MDD5587907.1 hypothetical protein [Candidatus Nanoarchaeia archaeon]
MNKSKVNSLYKGLKDLLDDDYSRICEDTDLSEINFLQDIKLFNKICDVLPQKDKESLERLATKFINVTKLVRENKLILKVNDIQKAYNKNELKFSVHFIDNLKGDFLLYFIPTYTYAFNFIDKKQEYNPNQVIKIGPDIFDYYPEAYIDKTGVSMKLTRYDESPSLAIPEFKSYFTKHIKKREEEDEHWRAFRDFSDVPILFDIKKLLAEGYDIIQRKKENRAIREEEKKILDSKGKKF